MIRTQIVLGILLMVVTIGAIAWTGATEEQRMATATDSQLARKIENGAYLFHNNCERCHGVRAEGIVGLCPPLNNLQLLQDRAADTGWTGSLHNWLVNTIRGGRLTSTRAEFVGSTPEGGMAMPFWSQDYGGPLRNDQIEDIAYFLGNMPDEPYEDPNAGAEATPVVLPTDDPEGVIAIGVEIYQANGCIGCHQLEDAGAVGVTGPTHEGMGTTAEARIAEGDYTGAATTAEEYIRESIVDPNAFVVEGYAQGLMPSYASMPEDQLNAIVQMLLLQE